MGLFDKFRKKVRDAASEVDTESLSAEAGSEEAINAISQHQKNIQDSNIEEKSTQNLMESSDDDWEDFEEEEELHLPTSMDDEWEDWDDEEEYTLPTKLSRKEKKILAKEAKKDAARKKAQEKEMKKRGGKEVKRLEGSKAHDENYNRSAIS